MRSTRASLPPNLTRSAPLFCLSMIFKDEAPRIARAIASIKPLLGAYELSDTGSVDDSCARAELAVGGLPGAIHHDEWHDFSHNRNLSLERARRHNLPILFLDSDDEIFYGEPEYLGSWDLLTAWAYDGPLRHRRALAVTPGFPAFWQGALHEQLTWNRRLAVNCVHTTYLNVRYRRDGVRGQNAVMTTERDIELLGAVPLRCSSYDRSQFYLARTLHHAGQIPRAITAYKQYLSTRQVCDETTFHSYWSLAALTEAALGPLPQVLKYLELAKASRPHRVEPMVMSARIFREEGHADKALEVCINALALSSIPNDDFVDVSYYGWRLHDELATAAMLVGDDDLGRSAITSALTAPFLPEPDRARLLGNLALLE